MVHVSKFMYLKGRENRPSAMPSTARAGSDKSQEPRAQSRFPIWVAGIQLLKALLAASQDSVW